MAAAQGGDTDALDRLLRRNYDRIHAVCRRLVGNDNDALDATQEALIAVVRSIGRFDGRAAFSTWVYRIATNSALDELRRRGRRPLVGLPAYERAELVASGEGVADRLDIDAALAELPHDFRVAVVLRDLCQLDYAEIAEVLDIPPGTVRSRIARGRAALAEILGGNPAPSPERPSPRP